MISIDKITRKFIQLDEYLHLLEKILETPENSFLEDKILIGSAKYYLQVSIESCLDVANHIIASERFRAPKDYADSFKVIQEQGLVPFDLGEKLRRMAKFRNRLVHLYSDIDNLYVYQFMQDDLKDIEKFKEIILKKFLTNKEHKP